MTAMKYDDTIAAIATASGQGCISIVRISGPESVAIAERVFRCSGPPLSQRPSHVVVHGFVGRGEEIVDEVLALVMRAPHTYTGEDVVEIQGHGGAITAQRILRCVLEAGARLAEPGEFTRRAFLNGRMDLTQAEAVQDLIRASSERAADIALAQLAGKLKTRIQDIYRKLLDASSDLAALLDFPEEDVPQEVESGVASKIDQAEREIDELLATWNEGRLLREGAVVVIAGPTNAGKSTLFNAILEVERAIVSPHPGTTRDFIEAEYVLHGIPVTLIDTAGLRETICEIEQEGVRRTRELLDRADVILYVIDASNPPTRGDLDKVVEKRFEKTIVVGNKRDLGIAISSKPTDCKTIFISAKTREGIGELMETLYKKLVQHPTAEASHVAISERHRALLSSAKSQIVDAKHVMSLDWPGRIFLASEALRFAAQYVGQITGEIYTEDLLDSIFSKFCIGK